MYPKHTAPNIPTNRSVRTYWLSGGPRISGTLQYPLAGYTGPTIPRQLRLQLRDHSGTLVTPPRFHSIPAHFSDFMG